jgi:hypothetical protein
LDEVSTLPSAVLSLVAGNELDSSDVSESLQPAAMTTLSPVSKSNNAFNDFFINAPYPAFTAG